MPCHSSQVANFLKMIQCRIKTLANVMHQSRSKAATMRNVKSEMVRVAAEAKVHRHCQRHRRNSVCTKRHRGNSLVRYQTIQTIPNRGITIATVTATVKIKVKTKISENIEFIHRYTNNAQFTSSDKLRQFFPSAKKK